ncbi:MAG: zinc ribbon domain-containing protein [Clostridiales bacterium]|nr:zinc ribbon domain-containing protein [Clostridiales bacterium]
MKFREKLARFMAGRYGADTLNTALLTFSLALFFISSVVRAAAKGTVGGAASWLIFVIAAAALAFALFRTFSRGLVKRRAENEWFMQRIGLPVSKKYGELRTRAKQRKTHRFFRCPGCGKTLRVPRGKGRIRITCPHCGKSFEKNT